MSLIVSIKIVTYKNIYNLVTNTHTHTHTQKKGETIRKISKNEINN